MCWIRVGTCSSVRGLKSGSLVQDLIGDKDFSFPLKSSLIFQSYLENNLQSHPVVCLLMSGNVLLSSGLANDLRILYSVPDLFLLLSSNLVMCDFLLWYRCVL